MPPRASFTVPDGVAQRPMTAPPVMLDRALRELFPGLSWARARWLIESGKVSVAERLVIDPATVVDGGVSLRIRTASPRPATRSRLPASLIVHVDADVVVVQKPAGVSTVPYEDGERGTLDQLVRALLNRDRRRRSTGEIGVVHRLDRDTTGLIVFARNLAAKRHLQQQFRVHDGERRYLALAHGRVASRTLRSRLVADRGDGLRGTTDHPRLGRLAITHVRAIETLALATLVECRLETGRTHQIRIHLAEAGHPLVGERVYARGRTLPDLGAPRIQLHAASLGFTHPRTGERLHFATPLPDDMTTLLARLRAG